MYPDPPNRYQRAESHWLAADRHIAQRIPASIRPWLLDSSSLTQRLITASAGHFEVQLLQQSWQQPRPSEVALLAMKPRQLAIVREVALRCYGQPWVFARSVMPAGSLTGKLRRLRQLDNSSLGSILFSSRGLRRSPFQLARVDGQSRQLPVNLQTATELWGRRCRFELQHKPIMVSEIFLPAFRCGPVSAQG